MSPDRDTPLHRLVGRDRVLLFIPRGAEARLGDAALDHEFIRGDGSLDGEFLV